MHFTVVFFAAMTCWMMDCPTSTAQQTPEVLAQRWIDAIRANSAAQMRPLMRRLHKRPRHHSAAMARIIAFIIGTTVFG
jgi:hypothetical protein